jgi:ABC transporter substrate binding protein (PQQ-dependent alcohol dehydrogenase system)
MKLVILSLLLQLGLAAHAVASVQNILVGYLGAIREPAPLLSVYDEIVSGEGLQGAGLALSDNATTGRLLGQHWSMLETLLSTNEDPVARATDMARRGATLILIDLNSQDLLRVADSLPNVLFFNIRQPDDDLRGENCRRNILHTTPSRAMLADALAQYALARNWRRLFMVVGLGDGDRKYAAAVRRAAERFNLTIVEEKTWTLVLGAGRSQTGHVTLQSEIPALTRAPVYDLLIVADEADTFGDYLLGRTARPQLVMGTHGLVAAGWSAVNTQWGAQQLQDRFQRQARRRMTAVDYAAWLAVRSIGEAALHLKQLDSKSVRDFLLGPEFILAGYLGTGLNFRPWDGQMRQPILIAGPRLLISVSPQPGFLHERTTLDTLGVDRQESLCVR